MRPSQTGQAACVSVHTHHRTHSIEHTPDAVRKDQAVPLIVCLQNQNEIVVTICINAAKYFSWSGY